MALNALVDSFCHNQKKCGTERVKDVGVLEKFAPCHYQVLMIHGMQCELLFTCVTNSLIINYSVDIMYV